MRVRVDDIWARDVMERNRARQAARAEPAGWRPMLGGILLGLSLGMAAWMVLGLVIWFFFL